MSSNVPQFTPSAKSRHQRKQKYNLLFFYVRCPIFPWFIYLFCCNLLRSYCVPGILLGVEIRCEQNQIHFLVKSLSGFSIRQVVASWNELGRFPLLLSSERDYRGLYNFFLKCWVAFTGEHIWAWYFLCWKVISYWFSFISWRRHIRIVYIFLSVLANCVFQGVDPFHLSDQCVCTVLFTVFLYCIFTVHMICSDIPSLSFDTSNLCPLSFFLS